MNEQVQAELKKIFNGRFSCARSAKEAARRLGKTFLVYDVKGISGRKRPYIHKNIDLHNVDIAIDRALKLYKKNRKPSKPQKATDKAKK